MDFSRDSVRSARGARKLNNQVAPRPALRTRVEPGFSPLYVEAGKSVPLRGYVFHRYDPEHDIGGDFAASGTFPSETFHARRGRTFELNVSVEIPETFRMFEPDARGEGAPDTGSQNNGIAGGSGPGGGLGYDEGADDCCLILQKGGDRTAPMSWALGIVNAGKWEERVGVAASGKARKSGYYFVFMWLDSAGWAEGDPADMRYSLSNPSASSTGLYSTQALRAVILDGRDDAQVGYAIEAGRRYSISFAVTLDSAEMTDGSWNGDGRVDFRVQEHLGRFYSGSWAGGTTTNLSILKGPTDSLEYLAKYGVRYSGRDAMFAGLGYRMAPWQEQGWIPYGHDSAAMEHKGFRLADRSLNSVDDLFGPGNYSLTCQHIGGASFFSLDAHRGLTEPGAATTAKWAHSPLGPRNVNWQGYGGPSDDTGAPSSAFNSQALRGYLLVFPRGSVNASFAGGVMEIEGYSESGVNDYRLEVRRAEFLGVAWATEQPFLIQAFRWNQQDIGIQEVRIWSSSRDYSDPRVVFSLRSSLDLDDETEPNLERLQAYWPYDDAGDRKVRELVRNKPGFLAPFGLGLSDEGAKGDRTIFLSGEGDALVFDLSQNPVWKREAQALLSSGKIGFAIELTCILPEAYYGVATTDPSGPRSGEYEAAYCPDIVSLAVKDADEAGSPSDAPPLLVMEHHSWWQLATTTNPERRPQGFQVDVFRGLESEGEALTASVRGFTRSGGGPGNWDDTAPWVGKSIVIQVGVQPSPDNRAGTPGAESEYRIYIAATPKGSLKYAAGEDPRAEFAYYQDAPIQAKDLVRTMLTVGGGWNPARARGYTEYSCRMIVDEVRFYGATAAGELPEISGEVTPTRRGKIHGQNSLPQRALTRADTLLPVGPGSRTVRVTDGSSMVEPQGNAAFHAQNPEDTDASLRERFLMVTSDAHEVADERNGSKFLQDFYYVRSVQSDGSQATLATPYDGSSANGVGAACFNLLGCVNFERLVDALYRRPLTIGSGTPYKPGETQTKDLVLSELMFENVSPLTNLSILSGVGVDEISGAWRIRVASPFANGGLANVLPLWSRGIVAPRRGEIEGLWALDSDLFAVAGGGVGRMDDRWRDDGPTVARSRSLEILSRQHPSAELRMPRAQDGVKFQVGDNAWPYWSTALYRDFTWVYDFEVEVESYDGIQTLMWLGCEYSRLTGLPSTDDNDRGIGLWLRLNDGRPEVVRESSGNFAGGATPPPNGRYVATAADRVPLGRRIYLRFMLEHYQSGSDILKVPGILINGRRSEVTVNGVETGLAGTDDWILANNGGGLIGSAGDSRNALFLGVGRDAWAVKQKAQFTELGAVGSLEFAPTRIVGRMHALNGRIAQCVVWRKASNDALVAGFPNYVPATFDYSSEAVRFRPDFQVGVGERIADNATETTVTPGVGLVESHPFLDLHNELGVSDERPSFATYQQRVYVANGGRVGYVERNGGGVAGVLQPTTRPKFQLERLPLWEPNYSPDGSSDPEKDPIAQAADGAGEQIYHYSSHGNNYVAQAWHQDLLWDKNDDASPDEFAVLGVKFYWRPRDVSGRIPLWGARRSLDSGGPYLDCVDGKAEFGWYDIGLKKRLPISTSVAVFRPGYWHYVYLRKAFPMQDPVEGNWLNSFWTQGRRRRADFAATAGTFEPGMVVQDVATGVKKALITKVTDTHVEYVLFTGSADFTAADAIEDVATTLITGDIDSTPYHMTGDALIVKPFPKELDIINNPPWSAWFTAAGDRSCITFTSEMPRPAGTTAIGPVTPKGVKYTGGAAGQVVVDTATTNVRPFHVDMVGMLWQFGSSSGIEKVYRVEAWVSSSEIQVVDETGANPNLTGITSRDGGVFSGVELVKDEDYDSGNAPDPAAYQVEFMGSDLARDPASGVARHSGEFASFAWGVIDSDVDNFYAGVELFEASPVVIDDMQIGVDFFAFNIFSSGGRLDELRVDSGTTFACVDTQPGLGAATDSTQPNEALEIEMDTEASPDAESCFWRYHVEPPDSWGRRKVQVVFYDPSQDQWSNPGPELVIDNPAEDKSNPSGMTRLLLTDLPVSYQRGPIERWVFVSFADDDVTFRQAIVPDNHSASVGIILDDNALDLSFPIETDNPPPPDCSVLGVSQGVMFYGGVRIAGILRADRIHFSKGLAPLSVPYNNSINLIGGQSERVVAMATISGRLLVWKKDAMFAVVIREGAALWEEISSSVGASGPQAVQVIDGVVYWLSNDRGPYLYAGSGGPVWIGVGVGELFEGDAPPGLFNVRPDRLFTASMAINRQQDQVVLALHGLEDEDQQRRLSIEIDSAMSGAAIGDSNGFRCGAYQHPNVTALGTVDRETSGPRHIVGGTVEGFVAYLDRLDTQRSMSGEDAPSQVTLGVGSTTTRLVLSASDSDFVGLEGIRGAWLSWIINGVEYGATALFSDGSSIWLDREVAVAPPSGVVVAVGATEWSWTSKVFDFDNPETRKEMAWLDLTLTPQASGQAILEFFPDFATTPQRVSVEAGEVSAVPIDLTKPTFRVPLDEIECKHLQFRIRSPIPGGGEKMELVDAVFREREADQHG